MPQTQVVLVWSHTVRQVDGLVSTRMTFRILSPTSGNNVAGFSFAENTSGSSRTGTISVGSITFTLVQEPLIPSTCTFTPPSASLTAAGGTVSVVATWNQGNDNVQPAGCYLHTPISCVGDGPGCPHYLGGSAPTFTTTGATVQVAFSLGPFNANTTSSAMKFVFQAFTGDQFVVDLASVPPPCHVDVSPEFHQSDFSSITYDHTNSTIQKLEAVH